MVKMKEKSLLIISNGYPSKEGFPSHAFVKAQVDELKKYFKKIIVIVPTPYFPDYFSKLSIFPVDMRNRAKFKSYSYDNVEVLFPRYLTLPFEFMRKKNGDLAYKTTLNCIKKKKIYFDLIHSHFIWTSGYIGVKLKKIYNKKLIITGHGFDVYDLPFRNKYWKQKIKNIIFNTDEIITVSNSNKNKLKELEFDSEVIPNGFDDKKFKFEEKNQVRKKLNLDLSKKVILSIGNLKPIKNHSSLINACRELKKIRTDFICYIIGGGELEESLKKQIRELELNEFVKILGTKPHKEIPLWMNAADVFVFPSRKESFGVVVIEALACGTPVVSTINGGAEEIITSKKYGYLYDDYENYKDLSQLIEKSLNKEWDCNKIVEYSKKYQWVNISKKILEVYEK